MRWLSSGVRSIPVRSSEADSGAGSDSHEIQLLQGQRWWCGLMGNLGHL